MKEVDQPIAQGRTAEIFAWGEGRVLKLFRAGYSRESRDYEFNIAQAVHRSGVPAPAAFEKIEVDGRHGIVYERIEGHTMLRDMSEHPERLLELAQAMADLHAQIHLQVANGLPRWRNKFRAALFHAPLRIWQKVSIARHTAALCDEEKVCHGDFHPDNILMTPAGPRVIDWNNAYAGHPLADIAWTTLLFRIAEAPPGSEDMVAAIQQARVAFLEAYLQRRLGANRDELNAWLLPTMVIRLGDNIASERATLLRMIDEAL